MKQLIAILVAVAALTTGAQAAAQTQLKIATLAPQNSGWAKEFSAGAKEIAERTDGRVRVKFFWGGAQGTESKVMQKIRIGQLHGGTFSPTDFQEQYPDVNIYGLPFFFQTPEEVAHVREQVDGKLEEGFDDLGYTTYGFAGGGFAYIMSNEPVKSLDDLRGKKVWLPEGDKISYEALKALRLSPVPLPVTDVLTGLQTGLIDIVAIPPVVALALQWHTKVKYYTPIPVLYPMAFLAISDRALKRVSDADRAVIDEVMRGVYARVDDASWAESDNAVEALASVGIERVEPNPGEAERIRKAMQETNAAMARDGIVSLELLEEIQAHLDAYRDAEDAQQAAASGSAE